MKKGKKALTLLLIFITGFISVSAECSGGQEEKGEIE